MPHRSVPNGGTRLAPTVPRVSSRGRSGCRCGDGRSRRRCEAVSHDGSIHRPGEQQRSEPGHRDEGRRIHGGEGSGRETVERDVPGDLRDDETDASDAAEDATTDEIEEDLRYADIQLAEESGALGGVTGGLVSACYRDDVPAAVLIVRCDPRLPDPRAARSVIENALEPLVAFDIDTGELQEQAEKIQQQKQQVAEQLQQMLGGKETETTPDPSMYQ